MVAPRLPGCLGQCGQAQRQRAQGAMRRSGRTTTRATWASGA